MYPPAPPIIEPARPTVRPTSIRVLRAAVGTQVGVYLASAMALFVLASRPSRDVSGFDFGPILYTAAAIYNLVTALLLVVPVLLLRPRSPAPRVVILVVEAATAGLGLLVLPIGAGERGQAWNTVYLAVLSLLGVVTIVAALRPSARHWTASSLP